MDIERFRTSPVGSLVSFTGTDQNGREFSHFAFAASPLSGAPILSGRTWLAVGNARAALGRLHQGSRFVRSTSLLRQPTLRREAQSTSALEGTYAPIEEVLAADVIEQGSRSLALQEVLNFVSAAEYAFEWVKMDRKITVSLMCELHAMLVRGTSADTDDAGRVRNIQVAIGSRGGSIENARFVPMRPGVALNAALRDLIDWINLRQNQDEIDPIVAAALVHYQFETLHPYNDGNGRLGRLLVVLQLLGAGMLPDSLLSVSPWFEARRDDYQDKLANVSATGDWDQWIEFFAQGIEASAVDTAERIETVLDIQEQFHERLKVANLRGLVRDIADYMVGMPYASLSQLAVATGKSYQTNKNAVTKLVELGILEDVPNTKQRVLRAPEIVRAYRN